MAKLTHTVSGNNVASFRSADIANIESLKCYFFPVQEGSGDPSPENVRPITGWNGIQIQHINKNFIKKYYTTSTEKKGLTIIPTERGIRISGTATARTACMLSDTNNIPFKTNDKVTFSLYLNGDISQCENPYVGYYKKVGVYGNATGSLRTDNNYTFTWTVPSAYGDTNESYIDSYIYIPEGVTVDFEIGLQAELASVMSEFEPHKESIIPIIFPTTGKNKFDENYIDIKNSTTLTYRSIYVGEQAITASSNMPKTEEHQWSNLFILPGQVTSGAGTGLNDFNINISRTITPIDGWITIAYRYAEGVDPRNYQAQIEIGEQATTYEPYSSNNTVYGGYVDIAKGEVVKEWEYVDLGTLTWIAKDTTGTYNYFYSKSIESLISITDLVANHVWYTSYFTPSTRNLSRTDAGVSLADNETIVITRAGVKGHIVIRNDTYTDVNEFKAYVTGKYLAFKLNTPIHYPMSKMELKSFLDNNNIWSNTNDVTEVTYNIIDHLLHKRMNIPKLTSKVIWNELVYPQKRSGPVITSSGDGVFHVTVTMTSIDYYTLTSSDHYMTIIAGHKYYLRGCPVTDGSIWFLTTNGNNGNQNDKGYATVATFNKSSDTVRTQIRLEPGTYDFYIKPIIVDLTQMFGAGNEPTKEEFEQLCKYNGIDLTQVQPFDLGTEKIWYINDYDITKYNIIEWNQMIVDGNFTNSNNWSWSNNCNVTFSNNQVTLHRDEATGGVSSITIISTNRKTSIPGHKYLIYLSTQTTNGVINISPTGTVADGHASYGSFPEKTTRKWIWECSVAKPIIGELRGYTGGGDVVSPIDFTAENYMIFDLTQMYGAGKEPDITEFERQCNLNNISLDANLPHDDGTKQLWII